MSDRAYAKVLAQQKTLTGSSPSNRLLQRTCACDGLPGIDGLCTECRDKRLTSQSSRRGFEAPSVPTAAQGNAPAQENVASSSADVERASRFGHDFSRIPVYYSPRLSVIQTKLQVNQPGDVYEQEADQVAEQVMRMTDGEPPVADDEDEAQTSLMRKQRAEPGANASAGPSDVPPIVHAVLNSGGGQPLDTTTRAFMEPRFGHDFSKVRVHTDDQAAQSARAINALAYTVGETTVFGPGKYAPGIVEGRRLIAHELTHVLQQRGPKLSPQRVARQSVAEERSVDSGLVNGRPRLVGAAGTAHYKLKPLASSARLLGSVWKVVVPAPADPKERGGWKVVGPGRADVYVIDGTTGEPHKVGTCTYYIGVPIANYLGPVTDSFATSVALTCINLVDERVENELTMLLKIEPVPPPESMVCKLFMNQLRDCIVSKIPGAKVTSRPPKGF